jgi:membrane protein YqaA with SNARE-associated domain
MLALIILAVTEPVCVPIPADVLVIGLCLGKPKQALKFGLTCAFFSVIGGTIAFSLGIAIGGQNVIDFLDKIHLGNKAQLALQLYQKYDFWAIAISALTPVPYMLFSWLGGMADVSIKKFVLISIVFRTLRFGSEAVLFYFFGQKAKTFIEKYFNLATIIVILLLAIIAFAMKKLGHLFTG